MTSLQQQIARALLARGISGSVSVDGRTVVDDESQLEAAATVLAKFFPDIQTPPTIAADTGEREE